MDAVINNLNACTPASKPCGILKFNMGRVRFLWISHSLTGSILYPPLPIHARWKKYATTPKGWMVDTGEHQYTLEAPSNRDPEDWQRFLHPHMVSHSSRAETDTKEHLQSNKMQDSRMQEKAEPPLPKNRSTRPGAAHGRNTDASPWDRSRVPNRSTHHVGDPLKRKKPNRAERSWKTFSLQKQIRSIQDRLGGGRSLHISWPPVGGKKTEEDWSPGSGKFAH